MSKINPYTRSDEVIPLPIKVFAWMLIFAGCFFAYVFNFNPSLTNPSASISDYSSQLGFTMTAVRVISSVVALLISVYFNNSKFMAITLVSRVVGEWGDVITSLVLGGTLMHQIPLAILGAIELWAVLTLFKNIKANTH